MGTIVDMFRLNNFFLNKLFFIAIFDSTELIVHAAVNVIELHLFAAFTILWRHRIDKIITQEATVYSISIMGCRKLQSASLNLKIP